MNELDIPKYTLITYSRDKNKTPRGVLVAVKVGDNGYYNIGYAQCREGDRFSKKRGLEIAIGRAYSSTFTENDLPYNLRKMFPSFINRCQRYYK